LEDLRQKKLGVIADLFAYRFVLSDRPTTSESIDCFNAALNRVPIEFIDNKKVLDAYHGIGNNFTAEKYYEFLQILLGETGEDSDLIHTDLIKNVPSVNKSSIFVLPSFPVIPPTPATK